MSKQFPVLYHKKKYTDPDRRRSVPWEMLTPFEANAQIFHGQTLQRLSERGGLGTGEMLAIIYNDKKWWKLDEEEVSWQELEKLIALHEGPQPATELEFLRWFYQTADFGGGYEPAKQAILEEMKRAFERTTNKKLPDGY